MATPDDPTDDPPRHPAAPMSTLAYEPGVCNIGPAEIARRRRAGDVGLLVGAGLYAGLVATGAPRPLRMLVALPATMSASGYLQAHLRFCAGFGSRGVYNLGELGRVVEVGDEAARARDRAKALRIGLASLAIGAGIGVLAVAAPR